MNRLTFKSKVRADGILHLDVPVGVEQADREVQVIIEPVTKVAQPAMTQEEWVDFVNRTAGSITDPSFRRHEQGDYETRTAFP